MARTMTALVAHTRGGPENLAVEQVAAPRPGPGEALLAVHAVGVTLDELTWDETWQDSDGNDRTPVILGHEVSGVVEDLGPGATDLAIGDEVYGLIDFNRDGAAAQYATVPADALARRPTTIDDVQAASLPLAAMTAWQALVDHAHVGPGTRVLVQGGAGGVGNYVVQLASALGATVAATARSTDAGFVREIGAEEVLAYDQDQHPDRGAYDVVVDAVGGPVLQASYPLVRPGGDLVTLRAPLPPGDAERLGFRATFFVVRPERDHLRRLAQFVDSGELQPVVAAVYPLADGAAAYNRDNAKPGPGKIVISV